MKTIAISLSPNAQKDDVTIAFQKIFDFWKNDEKKITDFEKSLREYFNDSFEVFSLNSGRSSLYLILKAAGVGKGDEVVIQSFTCSAVANPIKWLEAKPVFCDIGSDYNLDPEDLRKKITPRTKAVIIQHTFGIPADLENINQIARKNDLLVIEDLAHGLGARYKGGKLGTFSDVAFLSFGRDKAISSIFGGAIITKDKALAAKISRLYAKLKYPQHLWTFKQVMHPICFSLILPTYNLGYKKLTVGKIILVTLQKLKVLSRPVSGIEERGIQPRNYPERLPSALAQMAQNQLNKLDKFVSIRHKLEGVYRENLKNTSLVMPGRKKGTSFLRFPILTGDRDDLISYARKNNILLGNWYDKVVVPSKDLELFNYFRSSCPEAETMVSQVVNLPTYPKMTKKDALRVVAVVQKWINTKQKK